MHYEIGVRDCCPDKNYFVSFYSITLSYWIHASIQQSFEIINLYLDLQEGSISAVVNFIKIF